MYADSVYSFPSHENVKLKIYFESIDFAIYKTAHANIHVDGINKSNA